MSISAAPAATASRVSATLTASDVWPDGKPVATEATATPVPRSASAATPTSAGYTQTAAQDGISGRDGSGTTAFAHRWRTFQGVSEPSSVVRSIIDVAMRMPSRFAVVLIERRPSAAARTSTPTRLTGVRERLMPRSLARVPYPPWQMAKSEYPMLELAGREVRLSNPGKVYFPKPGWTKLDLVEYYLAAADAVLIHLRERPTVMKRFVNGINEDPIWQKRVPKNLPEGLQTATVAFPSGRTAEELVANDEAHLAWAVNLGVIDFNPHPVRR